MNDLTFLNQEIDRLTVIRDKLTDHIQNLHAARRRIRPSAEPGTKRKPPGTRLMFKCEQVAFHCQQWLDQYSRSNNGYSGVRILSEKAHISHVTLTNILGETLTANGKRQEYVSPTVTDKLMMAMGLPHLYNKLDEVHVPSGGGKPPEPPYSKCDD